MLSWLAHVHYTDADRLGAVSRLEHDLLEAHRAPHGSGWTLPAPATTGSHVDVEVSRNPMPAQRFS